MNRRAFLAGSVTGATAVLGGCTEFIDDEREGVILTHVELGNATDEPQLFDLLVFHDDEIIYWTTHEVAGGEGEVIEINAPDERGYIDVSVRVGDEWRSTDFDTEKYDGEDVIAVVTYGMIEDELLRISRRLSDRPTTTDG